MAQKRQRLVEMRRAVLRGQTAGLAVAHRPVDNFFAPASISGKERLLRDTLSLANGICQMPGQAPSTLAGLCGPTRLKRHLSGLIKPLIEILQCLLKFGLRHWQAVAVAGMKPP